MTSTSLSNSSSRSSCRKLSLSFLVLTFFVGTQLFVANLAFADNPKMRGKRLLSRSAVERADALRAKRARDKDETSDSASFMDEVIDERGVDGFNDLVLNGSDRNFFLSRYRGMAYLEYLDDLTDVRAFDELTTRSVTEKLILLQTADTMTDLLMKSPLAEVYRRVRRYFRTYQAFTTVKVDQGNDVQVKIGDHTKSENTFLRFRIHTSMREGIQPRMDIGENFRLKYDPLEQETMLEFEFDF